MLSVINNYNVTITKNVITAQQTVCLFTSLCCWLCRHCTV